jgi:hypothetical protein
MDWTQTSLTASGYAGFVPFAELPTSDVPREPGVYIVIRPSVADPVFLRENPSGRFKDKDPSVPVETLEAAWVPGTPVLYIGKASGGTSGKRGLRTRLDEYRRHGAGLPVGHWGGRYIWQLEDSASLLVAWKPTPDVDARDIERDLIANFVEHHKKRPFANLTG